MTPYYETGWQVFGLDGLRHGALHHDALRRVMTGARGEAVPSVSSEAVRNPPTVKGRDARRRLLEAGKKLGDHGYANARILDITQEAGLSSGAFYRYFKDRRDLLLVLLDEMLREVFHLARSPWDAARPEESVRITAERYFEFYERNSALLGVIVSCRRSIPRSKRVGGRLVTLSTCGSPTPCPAVWSRVWSATTLMWGWQRNCSAA